MPTDGGSTTLWRSVAGYASSAETYWHGVIDGASGPTAGNKVTAKADATTKINLLTTSYTSYIQQLKDTDLMLGGQNPYLINLFLYVSNVSSVSGVPANINTALKFKANQWNATSDTVTTNDDMRNSILSWVHIGSNYSELFSYTDADWTVVTDTGYTSVYGRVNGAYGSWTSYMSQRLTTDLSNESRKNCAAMLWDKSIGTNMGLDTDLWHLSSGADLKSILLESNNITTPTGATVIPMRFEEVLDEIDWNFVGINVDPDYS